MELIAFAPVPGVLMFLLRMISLMNLNNWKHAYTLILWYSSRFRYPWEWVSWGWLQRQNKVHTALFVYSFMFSCVCIKTRGRSFYWTSVMQGEKRTIWKKNMSKWESCCLWIHGKCCWILSTAQVGGAGDSATVRLHGNQVFIHKCKLWQRFWPVWFYTLWYTEDILAVWRTLKTLKIQAGLYWQSSLCCDSLLSLNAADDKQHLCHLCVSKTDICATYQGWPWLINTNEIIPKLLYFINMNFSFYYGLKIKHRIG